ncbi:testis-expressed protein 13D-like [Elephas maximus indicus]|uniref:testis-expressed protein 13D-like n=1 Tax=Elephas maximus indicus TaxID=99487 RepID=UPI002116288D|nr:testis-expressed protein 13D-like [Elephas maximus indicus]
MAVNFRDPRCGFRHREVVEFINEEIRSNGTDLDFYVAYSLESWSLVEDRLRAILCDPRVPHTFKGACAWSALAMSTTVVSRQRVQLLHRVRRLQEKVSQREDDLLKSLDEREVLRGQLLQAKRSAQLDPQPQEVNLGSRAQEQCATAWPQHAEEQGKVVAAGPKGRRDGEAQEKEAGAGGKAGNIYVPGSLSPWAQVSLRQKQQQRFPPDAWAMICTPGVQAGAGWQKEMGPLWDQKNQGEEEGAVRSKEIDALVDSRSHGKQEATGGVLPRKGGPSRRCREIVLVPVTSDADSPQWELECRGNRLRSLEVVEFINEEIVRNRGGPDFYVAYSSKPWSLVEDRLRAILSDPLVPRTIKRAYAWSALALSVRVLWRRPVVQVRRVRRLQEQVAQHEVATRDLASELQQLREEREDIILQLHQKQDDLQKSLDEREVLRGQLLQAKRFAQFHPPPQEIHLGSRAQELYATAWPQHAAEEQGKVAAAGPKGRQVAQPQEKEAGAGGVTEVETAGEGPSQMPRGMICTPGVQAAAGWQKEMGPLWDERSQGEEEGAVRSEDIDALVDSRSHGKQEATLQELRTMLKKLGPRGCEPQEMTL